MLRKLLPIQFCGSSVCVKERDSACRYLFTPLKHSVSSFFPPKFPFEQRENKPQAENVFKKLYFARPELHRFVFTLFYAHFPVVTSSTDSSSITMIETLLSIHLSKKSQIKEKH